MARHLFNLRTLPYHQEALCFSNSYINVISLGGGGGGVGGRGFAVANKMVAS